MSPKPEESERVHHFYVAAAKHLFLHQRYGIVSAQAPLRIKEAERYGLKPLLLYGLTVCGLPFRWMSFSEFDKPRSLVDVLMEGWSRAEGLRGLPDSLKIGRHLARACPALLKFLDGLGVRVEIADAKEKRLPAALRAAQEASRWLTAFYGKPGDITGTPLEYLCVCAQRNHISQNQGFFAGMECREIAEQARQWLALPVREAGTYLSPDNLDWEPGSWLSSWEASLPPPLPRYFRRSGLNGDMCLVTGDGPVDEGPEEDTEEAQEEEWLDSFYDNAPETAKLLIECWPNEPKEIARHLGITLRELRWFLSRKISLKESVRFELEQLLGIRLDETIGEFVAVGPYVLMARKAKSLEEAYISISDGGNANPREIVPTGDIADPSWRYVLIHRFGEAPVILMSPRGGRITERLPHILFNFGGISRVPDTLYRDVVSTCARACREPAANIHEMAQFASRHEDEWQADAWPFE